MIEIGSRWIHKDGGVYEVQSIEDRTFFVKRGYITLTLIGYTDQQGEIYVRTEKHFLESFKPVEPKFAYPMWFKDNSTNLVVRFDSLERGEVVVPDASYKAGITLWYPHTDTNMWTQIPELTKTKTKKIIVLETWLIKDGIGCISTVEAEAEWINTYTTDSCRCKLLSTREAEIDD